MPDTSRTLNNRLIYLAIFCMGIILYGKCLFFTLTHFDDTILLEMNQTFLGNIKNLPKLFTTDVFISIVNPHIYYRPLLNLLFMIEAQIAPDNFLLYHGTNVLLHIFCCVLVFKLFQQMRFSQFLSAVAALIFCVHPLNSSAVVWIPGRNDTLVTCFVLGSFFFFLRAYDTKRRLDYIVHMLLFFLALLVKETAIVLPILCFGYVYLVRGEKLRRRELVSMPAAYGLLTACWFLMRITVHRGFEIQKTDGSLIATCVHNLPSYFLYIGKVFLPLDLSAFPNTTDHSLLPGIAVMLALAGVLYFVQFLSRPKILFGFFWFFLFLSPTLIGEPIFYEHRAYCPLVGLLMAIAFIPVIRDMDFKKRVPLAGVAMVILILSLRTFVHEDCYQDRHSFSYTAYASAPSNDLSFICIATMHLDEGNFDVAEQEIVQKIQQKPGLGVPHGMLADVYASRREYECAAQEYERAIRLTPLNLTAYLHYGKMKIDEGQTDTAVQLWKKAVQINPDFLVGYYYLANCYLRVKNDPDSAWVYVRELQQRGETVLPELLQAIETHPRFGKKH